MVATELVSVTLSICTATLDAAVVHKRVMAAHHHHKEIDIHTSRFIMLTLDLVRAGRGLWCDPAGSTRAQVVCYLQVESGLLGRNVIRGKEPSASPRTLSSSLPTAADENSSETEAVQTNDRVLDGESQAAADRFLLFYFPTRLHAHANILAQTRTPMTSERVPFV